MYEKLFKPFLNFAKGTAFSEGAQSAARGFSQLGGQGAKSPFMRRQMHKFKHASPLVKGDLAIAGVGAGLFGTNMVADVYGDTSLAQRFDDSPEALMAALAQVQQNDMLSMYKQREIAQLTQQNAVNMAQYAPELFHQLMAGEILPRDTVAIGGTPRLDLIEQAAMQMSQGRGAQPTPYSPDAALQQTVDQMFMGI